LGREKKSLETVVLALTKLDEDLTGAAELFELAREEGDDETIEAIEVSEIEDEWTIAVQWHPEMTVSDELQFGLVKAFVEEARRRRPARTIGGSR